MTLKLSKKDIRLINRVQKNFPLCEKPFEVIAKDIGESQEWVFDRLKELEAKKVISRFGSVVKRKNYDFSTLAALKVPHDRVNDVAHLVSSYEEVTHNYLREHEFNLWFVIQSQSEKKLKAAINDLRQHMDFPMLNLPILESYHSDMVITL
jgi:DNA-binding Lrp family transcriptional regulator